MNSGVLLMPSVLHRWYQNLVSYGPDLVSESMVNCMVDSDCCVALGCVCSSLLWHCCVLVTSVVICTMRVASDSSLTSGCLITTTPVCCICSSVVTGVLYGSSVVTVAVVMSSWLSVSAVVVSPWLSVSAIVMSSRMSVAAVVMSSGLSVSTVVM